MPPVALRHDLWLLQGKCCLYTGDGLSDPAFTKSGISLDHMVPWARARVSSVENFVVTDIPTNSAKQHMLLSPALVGRWADHVAARGTEAASLARSYGWPTDLNRVVTIAAAMYRRATPATPTWAGVRHITPLGQSGRQQVLARLTQLGAPLYE